MKFLTKYEKETSFVALSEKKLPKVKSVEEYLEYVGEHRNDFAQVMLEYREEWLKTNGYEVTRENLLNADLQLQPQE